MAAIYEKLKMMREKAGLRQGQIADYLGVTQTFISKVETGERNLTVDQLESVVNLYGYSLAAFADGGRRPIRSNLLSEHRMSARKICVSLPL